MTFRNSIVAGVTLIREAIQSQNYQAGTAGWTINSDGTAEFTGMTINSAGVNGYIVIENGEIVVRRTSDDEIIAKVTSLGDGGFLTRDPDNPDVLTAELTSRFLKFNREVSPAQFSGEIEWNENPITTSLGLSSGRIDNTVKAAHVSLSSGAVGVTPNPSVTISGDDSLACTTYMRGDVIIQESAPSSSTPHSLIVNGIDQGRGVESYVSTTAASALGTVEVIGVTSGTVDFLVGRAYRITLHYQGLGDTSGNCVGFRMRRTSIAGTSLWDSLDTHVLRAANALVNGEQSQVVYNNTGSTLSTVIAGTAYRRAGAGNIQMFANFANPVWIQIEDVGAIADYPGAKAL